MGNSFQILRGKKSRWLMKSSVLAPKPVSISAARKRFCFALLQPEMGFSKKKQLETESKRWVIAGMPICGSLKPINTRPRDRDRDGGGEVMEAEEEPCSTTPTTKESRISDRLACPPAPRKRRPPSKCHLNGVREFFTPPDLETVFKLRTERAN
ncbi:hypothetical protein SAY87_005194 [Trapa incisa]|uniref:Cyclin-dependent protein kinase inhibitor SMR6 n=1 Tax=Trapa incisa TaxID=236973 RepID=A0AAN7K5F1_9MYRT|nr:hypothetical protein SAY87_005194 [Trapa incisa]